MNATVWFSFLPGLIVGILLGTAFIDRFILEIFLSKK